jgi:hypothetical protein
MRRAAQFCSEQFVSAKTATAVPARHPALRDALVQASLDPQVRSMEAANALTGDPARSAECMVLAHDRKQSVWALLEKACHEIIKANYDDHH